MIDVVSEELKELFGNQVSKNDASENRLQLPVHYCWTYEGVYVYHNLTKRELADENKNSNTEYVFVASKNISFGFQSVEELQENNLVKATFGTKGAGILSKLSAHFQNKPYIFGHTITENQEPIVSRLALDVDFVNNGVIVHANEYLGSEGYTVKSFKPLNFKKYLERAD